MRKHMRSLLCLALAVIMMASLLPMPAAAATTKDPTVAYEAFRAFLAQRESECGKKLWDDGFYNIVTTNKRDAKLDEIKEYLLVDLTGDGIEELMVEFRVEYNFEKYGIPKSSLWTLVYQYDYNTGKLVKIGEAPYWMVKVDEDSWKLHYQDDYIGVGDLYLTYGSDGKTYICDDLPFVSDTIYRFYGFNGIHMAEVCEFYANFIHDYYYGIQLSTGRYEYEVNGVVVSRKEYDARLAQYYNGNYEKLKMLEFDGFYADIDNRIETYHARNEFNKTNTFVDVAFDDYFAQPVVWAKANGITTGVSDIMFGSVNPCTRGQVVTFLWRAAGQPAPTTSENPFTDVDPNAFYYNAVLWAVENKITTGVGNGQFAPDASCNRGQIVTFLHRAMGEPKASRNYNPFDDVSALNYFYNAVMWAVEEKITSGTSNTTFAPDDTCTRAQVVTFLYRAYKDYVKPAPTPTPTPTPTDKDECINSFTLLKERVMGSGISDINGYPILTMTREFEGKTLISIIAYMEDDNMFLFTDRMIDGDKFTDTTMLIDADGPENAAITFDCDVTGISAVTTFSAKDYDLNTEVTFAYTPQGVYADSDVQTLCNLTVDTAMLGWERLLLEKFGSGLTLGDLGFVAWEKSLNPNWVENSGHSFSNGYCTKCGASE